MCLVCHIKRGRDVEAQPHPIQQESLQPQGGEGVLGWMESEVTSYRSTPKRDLIGRPCDISVGVKWLRHLSGRPSIVLGFLC